MNQSIEISEKLLQELERRKFSQKDSIENVIWTLINETKINTKKDLLKPATNEISTFTFRKKTLKEIFG